MNLPEAKSEPTQAPITRRAFVRSTLLSTVAAGSGLSSMQAAAPTLRIGLLTDIHYADLDTAGSRHYRDSIQKVKDAMAVFHQRKLDLVVCLGDLIDTGATLEAEKAHLATMRGLFDGFKVPCRFVLGNHCVWSLTKEEFLNGVRQKRSFDSLDINGARLIFLDACFREDEVPYGRQNYQWTDTEIPASQRKWLQDTLEENPRPALVFVHQRLDVEGNYGIKSAAKVREILEASGQVGAVFQGHNHVNDHQTIHGVHYLTLNAVIEGAAPHQNAFSILEFQPQTGQIKVEGFHRQESYGISKSGAAL